MKGRLALFSAGRSLADTTLDQRLLGAAALLEADVDLSPADRLDLLGLVVWPGLAAEVAR